MDLSVFNLPIVSGTVEGLDALDPGRDNRFMVMPNIPTWDAFICIASILELACLQGNGQPAQDGFHIVAPICKLPAPLSPTLQQLSIPHKPYVDMIPWPAMRDRVLSSLAAMNELEFVADMSSNDIKVWGSTPWDPFGWEVGPQFAKKWWFLMDDGILQSSNFWRAQRGEEPLVLGSL